MPFPQRITRFNRDVVNPRMRHLARIAPYLGVVHHVGRKSSRNYATPVMVFRAPGGWLFALTYGSQVDWARNVVAARGCSLEHRGTTFPLADPILIRDPGMRNEVPLFVRPVLASTGVAEFLLMTRRL